MKYWRVYWLALDYSPRSRLTGIHQFNFFKFSLFFKDSDGLSLAHNSTEETPRDKDPTTPPGSTQGEPSGLSGDTVDERSESHRMSCTCQPGPSRSRRTPALSRGSN